MLFVELKKLVAQVFCRALRTSSTAFCWAINANSIGFCWTLSLDPNQTRATNS